MNTFTCIPMISKSFFRNSPSAFIRIRVFFIDAQIL